MADPNYRRDEEYAATRLRARPGAVPATVVPVVPLGEPVYDTVIDPVTGQRVSAKPANAAMLAGQKARLERELEVELAAQAQAQARLDAELEREVAQAASQARHEREREIERDMQAASNARARVDRERKNEGSVLAEARAEQEPPATVARNKAAAAKPVPTAQRKGGSGSRITSALLLALFVPLLSMFLTGKSYTFGMADNWRPALRNAWRASPFFHEKHFTLTELAQYDGSNPDKPLYLAVDGVVFDVSANPRIYGEGGSYNFMTGRDASRAFITGCFETHRTHDLRGLTIEQLKSLDTWKDFFDNSDKYFRVGRVDLPPIEEGSPIPPDCHVDAEQADAHKHVNGKVPQGGAQAAGHKHGAKKPGKKDPHDGTTFKARGDNAKGHNHGHGHKH